MDTKGPQQFRPVQFTFPQTLKVAVGVPVALFALMVGLTYPQVAGGVLLGGVAMVTGSRLRSWLGNVRMRLHRVRRTDGATVASEDDSGYSTAPR